MEGSTLNLRPYSAVALVLLFTFGAARADAGVILNVEIGFGDTYVSGAWTPVRVELQNQPDPSRPNVRYVDFMGEVRITVIDREGERTRYTEPVDLPRQAHKTVEIPVILADRASEVVVDMVDQKSGVVARVEIRIGFGTGVADQRNAILVKPTVLLALGPTESPSFPTSVSQSLNIQPIPLPTLPSDFRGYDGVRILIVRGQLSRELNANQLDALETWIEFGGQLVVVVPRNQAELKRDTWLPGVMPAAIDTTEEIQLGEIVPGSGKELTLLTRWGDIHPEARVLWDSRVGPIALSRNFGVGRVIALGVDPASLGSSELRTPLGSRIRNLFDALAMAPAREDLRSRHYWSTEDVDPFFANIMILPNVWIVVALLALFVVVVGPLNFYLLRRARRLELAWITIPILSSVFFVAVYGYGLWAKGGDQHYASIEILHLGAGSSEGILLWNSVQFSPRKNDYRFSLLERGSLLPLMSYYENPQDQFPGFMNLPAFGGPIANPVSGSTRSNRPSIVTANREHGYDLLRPVDQWMMAFYQGERPLKIEGTIDGRVIADGDDGRATVQIENNTDSILGAATICIGESRFNLGDIEPGESIERVVTLRGGHSPTIGSQLDENDDDFHRKADEMIRDGAYASFPLLRPRVLQRRCRLIARQVDWTSGVKMDPVPDFAKRYAMVEVDLPLEIRETSRLSTKNVLRREIYDFEQEIAFQTQKPEHLFNVTSNWVEVLIAPPRLIRSVDFIEGRLKVTQTAATSYSLLVEAFNFMTGEWESVKGDPREIAFRGGRRNWSQPIDLRPEWINPIEPMLRLRLEGVLNTSTRRAAMGNGVLIQDLEVEFVLAPRGENPIAGAEKSVPRSIANP